MCICRSTTTTTTQEPAEPAPAPMMEKAGLTKTGPNDAEHVVWANGKYFFISFMFFYINLCSIAYLGM